MTLHIVKKNNFLLIAIALNILKTAVFGAAVSGSNTIGTAVIVLAHDSPSHTRKALRSITAAAKDLPSLPLVYVSVDDNPRAERVKRAALAESITHETWLHTPKEEISDRRTRIAQHYHFVATRAFETATRTHVLLFEDDLRLSPDALVFLLSTIPYLTNIQNDSVVCASAWNDNGQASQPGEATLTSFFPGLGWVLSRKLWENLAPHWPGLLHDNITNDPVATGWDFWMRARFVVHGWLCLTPTTSRIRHIGVGTNVDATQRDQQYAHAHLSTAAVGDVNWDSVVAKTMDVTRLSQQVQKRLNTGRIVYSVSEAMEHASHQPILPYFRANFVPLAESLSLWPTPRGDFCHTLLVHLPNETKGDVLLYDRVRAARHFRLPTNVPSIPTTIIGERNESCADACFRHGAVCSAQLLDMLNDCTVLSQAFSGRCVGCTFETGADLPARVSDDAPLSTAGWCLVTESGEHSCYGRFDWTARACSCSIETDSLSDEHDEL